MSDNTSESEHPQSSNIAHWIGRVWLKLFGWKIIGCIPKGKQFVLIGAHHTSNWDLPLGLAMLYTLRLKVSWMGKQSLFTWPMGPFIRLLGGIPVDRQNPSGVIGQMAEQYRTNDRLVIGLAPSGTRSKRPYWRSGFYWLAKEANIPILCAALDYPSKTAHIGFCLMPSEDVEHDMEQIRSFYADIQPKYPAAITPIQLRDQ